MTDALEKKQLPKFQLLGMNVGANDTGDVTFTGKGRYFAPFGNNYAFQSEGEYFYNKGQREGQFDFGLVDRIGRFQAGLFSSFKHVNLTGDQTGGTLGEGAVTFEYLFKWGKVGAFGTKAFLDDAIVNSANVITPAGVFMNNLVTERYLRVVDQAGLSGTAPLFGKNYFEGNVGYLRSTTAGDRLGGTLRLIFPVSDKIAFTLEGGVNETLLGRGNNGRVVAGVQFGNQHSAARFPGPKHPVPVQIPRVRYEVLTRTVRNGNAAPDRRRRTEPDLAGRGHGDAGRVGFLRSGWRPHHLSVGAGIGAGRNAFSSDQRQNHLRRGGGAELQLPADGERHRSARKASRG